MFSNRFWISYSLDGSETPFHTTRTNECDVSLLFIGIENDAFLADPAAVALY